MFTIRILVDGQAVDHEQPSEILAEARYESTVHLVRNDGRYHDFEVTVQLLGDLTGDDIGRAAGVREVLREMTKPEGE